LLPCLPKLVQRFTPAQVFQAGNGGHCRAAGTLAPAQLLSWQRDGDHDALARATATQICSSRHPSNQLDERLDETLACRPDILIADEPTTALDVTIRAAGSLPRSALQMTRRRLGGFNRRCARTQRGGQMPAADDAANSPCRSNNEAGDLDRRAV
jgi:hypothetical protein